MSISLIVLFHRPRALRNLLVSLRNTAAPAAAEIIVIFNAGNSDEAEKIRAEFHDSPLIFYSSVTSNKSELRNIGLEKAAGKILHFLDDDVTVPENFLQALEETWENHPEAAAIGGPNLSPDGSSSFGRLAGRLLASRFVAGRMADRYRIVEEKTADDRSLMLCNLGFRKSILQTERLSFSPYLDYNEENFLLKQLRKRDFLCLYTPKLPVFHERRKTAAKFLFQVFRSGRGRARSIKLDITNFGLIYILPSLWLIYLLSLLRIRTGFYFLPLGLYAGISLFHGLLYHGKGESSLPEAFLFPAGALAAHFAYGTGFLIGLLMPLPDISDRN
ncbi:MAG TPA: glycosyltransferase [bacterium]|nr:glycosyltransferase [bacterium]